MKILVDDTIKELIAIDPKTGTEWTQDLLGNADAFADQCEETGLMTMAADDYAWWDSYICAGNDLAERVLTLRESLPTDILALFENAMTENMGIDYDQTQDAQIAVVEEFERAK